MRVWAGNCCTTVALPILALLCSFQTISHAATTQNPSCTSTSMISYCLLEFYSLLYAPTYVVSTTLRALQIAFPLFLGFANLLGLVSPLFRFLPASRVPSPLNYPRYALYAAHASLLHTCATCGPHSFVGRYWENKMSPLSASLLLSTTPMTYLSVAVKLLCVFPCQLCGYSRLLSMMAHDLPWHTRRNPFFPKKKTDPFLPTFHLLFNLLLTCF